MKLSIEKSYPEIKFLTKLTADGKGSILLNMPNVKQFERELTLAEVAHSQYLLFSVSGGAMTFGESEPGDVLGEAVSNTGLVEDQAAMISSLTDERDTAARAAANANDERSKTAQELAEANAELNAVRNRLREVTQEAVDETGALRKELDTTAAQLEATRKELASAGEALVKSRDEVSDLMAKLAKAEADLLEEKTKPEPKTNPEASGKPVTA